MNNGLDDPFRSDGRRRVRALVIVVILSTLACVVAAYFECTKPEL